MRKYDLLKALWAIPGNPVVALLDVVANMKADDGDGSSAGVYVDYSVFLMKGENVPDGARPWISIQFTPDPPEA